MGSAGAGDVLTGTVAAMFCPGLPAGDAMRKNTKYLSPYFPYFI